MAENKKSFLMYCDYLELFSDMTDEYAGKLIKHIMDYVNDKNPVSDDPIIKAAFILIKQQLKRDLKKWEDGKGVKSTSGHVGNLKRWHPDLYKQYSEKSITLDEALIIAEDRKTSQPDTLRSQNIAEDRTVSHRVANIAVTDTVNVTVINKDKAFVPPSLEDVKKYFKENGYREDAAEKAFKGYDVANWHDSKNNKIRNWKQKMIHVWFTPENLEPPKLTLAEIGRKNFEGQL